MPDQKQETRQPNIKTYMSRYRLSTVALALKAGAVAKFVNARQSFQHWLTRLFHTHSDQQAPT